MALKVCVAWRAPAWTASCATGISASEWPMLADLAPRRLRNHFHRAGNLRSNRQHTHMPARRLPEALEDFHGRGDQIFPRMHAAPFVAEKRPFEMNAQRTSLRGLFIRRGGGCFNRVGQAF